MCKHYIKKITSHSRRLKCGWKKKGFVASQVMLDVVEVLEGFYDPERFVVMGVGAEYGLKMLNYEGGDGDMLLQVGTKKLPSGEIEQKGKILFNSCINYIERMGDDPVQNNMLGFLGMEMGAAGMPVQKLNGRPMHYGDTSDQFPCEAHKAYQRATGARLHNTADLSIPHEHPIRVDNIQPASGLWPSAVTDVMEGILQHAGGSIIPKMDQVEKVHGGGQEDGDNTQEGGGDNEEQSGDEREEDGDKERAQEGDKERAEDGDNEEESVGEEEGVRKFPVLLGKSDPFGVEYEKDWVEYSRKQRDRGVGLGWEGKKRKKGKGKRRGRSSL